jgi:hypothetical protein
MKYLRSCFEQENKRWARILAAPQKLEEHLSKRLDCDKIIFAPRLNHSQMNALRSTQTADAIRLQQFDRAIRNLEASIAEKRQYLATKRSAQFVCRLLAKRKPKVARIVEKLAAAVDHRSLREMQNLLFKIKRKHRAAHKRYAQIHGFNSYANRSTIQFAHRQQNAL